MRKRLLLLSLFFIACVEHLPESTGRARDIYVFSRFSIKTSLKNMLRSLRYTPQPENEINLRFKDFEHFKGFMQSHTIILILYPTDSLVSLLLGGKKKGLYFIKEAFAKEQLIILVSASTSEEAKRILEYKKEEIKSIFRRRLRKRLFDYTFLNGRNKKLEKTIRQAGFSLMIPRSFNPGLFKRNFIYIHAHEPDRMIFIARIKGETSILQNPLRLVFLRDSLTNLYYNGDYIFGEYIKIDEDTLNSIKCIVLRGLWQNDSLYVGGPFTTFAFVKDRTTYIIDGAVFAPAKKKLSYILELESIISTFKLE